MSPTIIRLKGTDRAPSYSTLRSRSIPWRAHSMACAGTSRWVCWLASRCCCRWWSLQSGRRVTFEASTWNGSWSWPSASRTIFNRNRCQSRPASIFAASAQAANHVGGDFHDVFETATGRIAIVLGDVSGKGVPAALLVSVLHGAIRSSSGSQHETACERINRMLCERTASERYATLF
jgi:hypothetical protein